MQGRAPGDPVSPGDVQPLLGAQVRVREGRYLAADLWTPRGKTPVPAIEVDATFECRLTSGKRRRRQIRFFMPAGALSRRRTIPAIFNVHYELGADGAAEFVRRGWMVATFHSLSDDSTHNFVGPDLEDNVELAKALFRMPLVDARRVAFTGVSAGGYQTSMVSALTFGARAAHCICGVANLTYNLRFFLENDRLNDPLD